MKSSPRSILVLVIVSCLSIVTLARAQSPWRPQHQAIVTKPHVTTSAASSGTGPNSPLYLTAGDQNMIWVIQGNSVINSWAQHNGGEYAIAVLTTVRTLGVNTPGSDYTLIGNYTGTNYPYPILGDLYDGTSDGMLNYSVDFTDGGVYTFHSDWSSPTLLFATPSDYLGIAYDRSNNTIWMAAFDGMTIEHRTTSGAIISTFPVPFSGISCLALDPSDGSLWMGSQSTKGTFYQYSQGGVPLRTVHYPTLESQNTLGGEFITQDQGLELNGQGTFTGPTGGTAYFQISDVENDQITTQFYEGEIAYRDYRNTNNSFTSGKITSVSILGTHAQFSGIALVGAKKNQIVTFTVNVTANQHPTTGDTFSVSLSNGYTAGGNLLTGTIGIVKNQ